MPRTALITNVRRYFGPDALEALADTTVFAHDAAFADAHERDRFAAAHPGVRPLTADTPEAALDELARHVDHLDVLLCNHFSPPEGVPLADTHVDLFRDLLETLAVEPYRFIRAALPLLGPGQIVVTSSAAATRPGANGALYAAARSAASTLAQALARELGPREIGVNVIAPNYYASDDTYSQAAFDRGGRFHDHVLRNVPLGRLSRREEAQALLRFLCSDQARFISGEVVHFTGGWL